MFEGSIELILEDDFIPFFTPVDIRYLYIRRIFIYKY